ncbi:DUF4349 domain-containing protein [Candidatus Omnitrophota bacterium]
MFNRHVKKQLSAYLDNQLSEVQKQRIEDHLQTCPMCAQELNKLKLVSEKLKTIEAPNLQEEFDSSVKDAILRQELEGGRVTMERKPLAKLVPAGVIAGILVLLVVGVNMRMFVRSFDLGYRGRSRRAQDVRYPTGTVRVDPYREGDDFKKTQPRDGSYIYGVDEEGRHTTIDQGVFSDETVRHRGGAEFDNSLFEFAALENRKLEARGSDRHNLTVRHRGGGERGVTFGAKLDTSDQLARNLGVGGTVSRTGELRVDVDRAYVTSNEELKSGYLASTPMPTTDPLSQVVPDVDGTVIVIRPTLPATGQGEMIIRTGWLTLEVKNGKEAYKKATEVCQELGGYISSSDFYKDPDGREGGTITMRIPKAKFDTALDTLSALGKVEGMNTSSQDVSQQYTNLKAQLDAKMVIYEKMLEALNRRKVSIPDAIRMESELTPVARAIEDLKLRIEHLNNAVSFNTITLNFYEPEVSTKALQQSKEIIRETALSATISAIKFLAAAIPVAIVIGFWIVIGVVTVLAAKHWIAKLFKRD